ncbi:polysaccharide deacetylase family protein [Polaromonas naphthalenivorans]|uniref:hypothetical protein n=1 Tax=Polaromonas naphthalenivorans TaxID=216465 RepID=UPI0012ECFE0F|nr:hypothetical protein [Polaromonas naphthalenivorans]
MKRIAHRLFNDFLMPSRLDELERVLLIALFEGYQVLSICHFLGLAREGSLDVRSRYLILRHDIDTDVATAKEIWQLERRHGICASFFFRLQTADIALMKEIHAGGGEVGYHFEEIATVAKRKGLKRTSNLDHLRNDAGELFCENLIALRKKSGLPLRGIASHGDFVNRRLGIINFELLTPGIRQLMDIDYEAYDAELEDRLSSRFSDLMYPKFWKPANPVAAIKSGDQVVKLLIHPRQWQSNSLVNAKDNAIRIYEGFRYWAA